MENTKANTKETIPSRAISFFNFIPLSMHAFMSQKPDPKIINMVFYGVLSIFVVIGLTYTIYYFVQSASKIPLASPENVALVQGQRMAAINADTQIDGSKSWNELMNTVVPGEQYLVNICPLTASIGGYVGGVKEGVFYSDFYLQKALRAGIRSFVLPICVYMDDNKRPPNWPISGDPAIVARDESGKVISLNGLSVRQFCTDLIRFNSLNPVQSSEPLFIHLIMDKGYLPDSVKNEKKYAKILSKLASDLSVIPDSMRLTTIGQYGSAIGSQNEGNILTQVPLRKLVNKVLIFTDFDIKIGLKDAYSNMRPTLYDYTNFTVKPIISQNTNVGTAVNARSLKLGDISGSNINWTDQARTVYHTTLDYNLKVPDVELVDNAIRTGIQVVPIPFYTTDQKSLKPISDLWKGYAWRIKEPTARYMKPDPVVPAKPNASMNARVDSDLQPGQLKV